jgi:hypothetical protein
MLVVVGYVLGQNLLEMAATQDEDSVEALSAGRANKTLGDRVPARGSNGHLDHPYALSAEDFVPHPGQRHQVHHQLRAPRLGWLDRAHRALTRRSPGTGFIQNRDNRAAPCQDRRAPVSH